jgi:hypothetical protein
MGGSAPGVIGPRFLEAELAVDGEAHLRGVIVFLAVVLPPADGAKAEGCRGIERLVLAAGAPEAYFDLGTHTRVDGKNGARGYGSGAPATYIKPPVGTRAKG